MRDGLRAFMVESPMKQAYSEIQSNRMTGDQLPASGILNEHVQDVEDHHQFSHGPARFGLLFCL
jgi:hypothetical protein